MTPDQKTIARLEETVLTLRNDFEELRESFDFLKSEFNAVNTGDREHGLTQKQQAIFNLLKKYDWVTKDRITSTIYAAAGLNEPQSNTIEGYISHMRKKLQPHGYKILSRHGLGYHMIQENVSDEA